MAALVVAAGPYLPLLALGGMAGYLAQTGRTKAPEEHRPQDENWRIHMQREELEANGANASAEHALYNKFFLMGGDVKEELSLQFKDQVWEPNRDVNPIDVVNQRQVELMTHDRNDTLLSLSTAQGEVRARGAHPVVSLLTPEIHHPHDESKSTSLAMYRHVPKWANHAQILQVRRNVDQQMEDSQRLMAYDDSQFFARAPGQSFRYE